MRHFLPFEIRFAARALLLFGVFAGLLFSCGEGIRLLPFPPAETAAHKHLRGKSDGRVGYEENLHRFENHQKNQTKLQRQPPSPLPVHHRTDVFDTLKTLFAASSSIKTKYSAPFPPFELNAVIAALSGRAPPPPPSSRLL